MSPLRGNLVSKMLRKTTKFLWAKESLSHLESIRRLELDFAQQYLPREGRILEIGAGTGWQAAILQEQGFLVNAIDIDSSNYKDHRIFPVLDYDGHRIPFGDDTFDVVFSSNALEHIPHVQAFQQEIHRVLKPRGVAVHIVPSSAWRFWTNITHVLKSWKIPDVHGEHAVNALMEMMVFRKVWWQRLFESEGWQVQTVLTCPIFYTGRSLMAQRISLRHRNRLSRVLGGSTNLFVLQKTT